MRSLPTLPFCALLATLVAACGPEEDEVTPASLNLSTGHETDTWSEAPAVTEVTVEATALDGTVETFTTVEPPAGDDALVISLDGASPGSFRVEGRDGEGEVQVRGQTAVVNPELGGSVPVFAARVGRFSRPPWGLFEGQGVGLRPPVAMLADRYVMVTGAHYGESAARLDGYDLRAWSISAPSLLPCPAAGCSIRSLAVMGATFVVALGDDWGAWADYSCGSQCTGDVALPNGLDAFADVAGGDSTLAPDGSAYIVGATRPEAATSAIMQLNIAGWEVAHHLTTPRVGAAATWVEGRGLLVVGGSSEGAGAELLEPTPVEVEDPEPAAVVDLPYPADPTAGAALVAFDARRVVRVGGLIGDAYAPSVVYDLDCTESCAPAPLWEPVELADVDAFRVGDALLVVGTNADGFTEARRVTEDGIDVVALREPRRGGSAVQTPLGQVVVIGGELEDGSEALVLELYQP